MDFQREGTFVGVPVLPGVPYGKSDNGSLNQNVWWAHLGMGEEEKINLTPWLSLD